MRNKEKIYSISAILIMIDQFIKLFIRGEMDLFQEIIVIPKFFSIYYIENDGAAFSILGGATVVLIIISVVSLFILDKFITKENINTKFSILYYGMIFSGIVGNLIDRCLYGNVTDYLSFNIFGYSAPIFNFADICIVVGFLFVIIDMIKSDINERKIRK